MEKRTIAGWMVSLVLIGLMALAAELSGIRELIFPEMAALLEEINSSRNSKGIDGEAAIRIRGAVLLNDTVTAERYADEIDLLGCYAEMRNMDEDVIRDSSISDCGLDVNGRRS